MWRVAALILLAGTRAFAQGAVPVPACPDGEESWKYRDYSVISEDLPDLRARWPKRGSVSHRGVVPVVLNARGGGLFVTFAGPIGDSGYPGALEDFMVFEESESPPWGNSFSPLWQERKTGRSLGPIHAAIRVRPREDSSKLEYRQVVVYNPPGRPDILLVAKREFPDDAWSPVLRVDMPKATRFDVIQTGWH